MYAVIKKLPTTRTIYVQKLVASGVISEAEAVKYEDEYRESLDRGEYVVNSLVLEPNEETFVDWKPYLGHELQDDWDTSVDIEKLKEYGRQMAKMPEGYKLQDGAYAAFDAEPAAVSPLGPNRAEGAACPRWPSDYGSLPSDVRPNYCRRFRALPP